MSDVSTLRLTLLRAMYLVIAVGLGLVIWPSIMSPPSVVANSGSVVRAMLGALALVSLLGLRYPLQMLPVLIFELVWKVIWIVASALPMSTGPGLDAYASETLFACAMGVVLVPLVLPWGYLYRHYIRAPSTPWLTVTNPALSPPAHPDRNSSASA
jgi:membrane associated rhomboid family serine protease